MQRWLDWERSYLGREPDLFAPSLGFSIKIKTKLAENQFSKLQWYACLKDIILTNVITKTK
ncbi:hypothetical protein DSM107003_14380 [Trichormus variabilis SAG 1403-4b]|uniref:Uncharacterized protein n=1 Tax=Trichormus variabilis SAG 1403-4b TaxID=447716 RepID=A0A3S1CU66_ANAVA|nr:hypothetical protein DSM107003_14380 [Trichormus variabilis SAG 1403-4b]